MALLVLDSSSIGVSKGPNKGFVIQLSEIDGFPPGMKIMIPFEAEHADEVYEAIADALDKTVQVQTATPGDLERTVKQSGLIIPR